MTRAHATSLGVPFQRPELPPLAEIDRYFAASRSAGWYSNGGPCYDLLAARASTVLGERPVVPVSSAGIGLIAALRALVDPRAGGARRVVLPSFTFAATAAAVVWCGLEPVFCDIEEHGWHLCPDRLEEAVAAAGGDVAAVVACSAFGTPPADAVWAGWAAVAERWDVPLIVDSAAGLGNGAHTLPAPDAEVFSMHATKPVAVGEGGLVALRADRDATAVRTIVNHGIGPEHRVERVGLNGKLDEWSCATALAALDHLEASIGARRAAAGATRDALAGADVTFQAGAERSSSQFVPVLLPSAEARDEVLAAGRARDVGLRTYYAPPLHDTPAYGHHARAGTLVTTDDVSSRIVSLPMAADLSSEERAEIVACFGI